MTTTATTGDVDLDPRRWWALFVGGTTSFVVDELPLMFEYASN